MTLLKHRNKPSIVGAGLVALDIVVSPKSNEFNFIGVGGTCGNVMTIMSFLGWASFPISRLSDDQNSRNLLKDLKRWGVSTDYTMLEPTADVPIIVEEIFTDKNGNSKHRFHWKICPKCGTYFDSFKSVTLPAIEPIQSMNSPPDVYFFDRATPANIELARHYKDLGSIIYFEPSAKADPKHLKNALLLADVVKYSSQRFQDSLCSTYKIKPFIEIQTFGSYGLKFATSRMKNWSEISAFIPKSLVDACGCGDWTTAGFISEICSNGRDNLLRANAEQIREALRVGQAMASWNCEFEGARGGMYSVSKPNFKKQISDILKYGNFSSTHNVNKFKEYNLISGFCPSCVV
ncbi:MAG TPA: hypothetical protein PK031_06905 [Pseudomonadales bacterium]|nr:hypothetical protein [Pseudomonadales bacterium]